jgi:hypothetical protein
LYANFEAVVHLSSILFWRATGRKTLVLTFGFASNTDGKVIYTYEWQEDPKPTVKPQSPQPGEDKL